MRMKSAVKESYGSKMLARRCGYTAFLARSEEDVVRLSTCELALIEHGEMPTRLLSEATEAKLICVRGEKWKSGINLVDTLRLPLGTDVEDGAGGQYLQAIGLMGGSALLDCRWTDEAVMRLLGPMVPHWWDADRETVEIAIVLAGARLEGLEVEPRAVAALNR